MAKHVILLLVAVFTMTGTGIAADPAKEPVFVWEYSGGQGATRVQFLPDGTTDTDMSWEQNLKQLKMGEDSLTIADSGRTFTGRIRRGAEVRGRLLMLNIMLDFKSSVPVLKVPADLPPDQELTFSDKLVGPWEMTLLNRRKDKQLHLSLDLADNGEVLDEDRMIATWGVEKKTKVVVDFVDARFQDVLLSSRNADTLFGKARTDGDTWTLTLQRIRPVAECTTDSLGKIVLYSNGRIGGTNGLKSNSYWQLVGQELNIANYSCTLSEDLTTFTGHDHYGRGVEGIFVAVSK